MRKEKGLLKNAVHSIAWMVGPETSALLLLTVIAFRSECDHYPIPSYTQKRFSL